jgi:diphosphomevalonate decarboxylase
MGKGEGNVPSNVSLSYTLDKFISEVSLEICEGEDVFVNEISLDEKAIRRFLEHLNRIKNITNCRKFFRIKSRNNFPHAVGVASSASSFAALTLCSFKAMSSLKNVSMPSLEEMSRVSRQASGSSCRSFFSPWSVWEGEQARGIDIRTAKLLHNLLLIDQTPKAVSSSEAHELVKSSLLFHGRVNRARARFEKLVPALNNNNWREAYQLCWEEFWDMHALFETSSPAFGYFLPGTIALLLEIRKFWQIYQDGPLATVDAGCNVHLLWREDQEKSQKCLISKLQPLIGSII